MRQPFTLDTTVYTFTQPIAILSSLWLGLGWVCGPVSAATPIDFNRQIRPILSENCFACHGPDNNRREADLRLDQAESALRDRGDYQVVKPGDPAASELLIRLRTADPDLHMPPPATGKQLTPQQVALLEQWIAAGAEFQPHWSFVPPKRPALPTAAELGPVQDWAQNPIDAFVARKWREADLLPNEPAEPRTLARRLAFDLTGLPPTPEQVDRLTQADAHSFPAQYQKYVEELLASPHFGERLAIYWLDLVRYADTIGYHSDNHRDIAPYRDYVIEAFNENIPFDQFTIEQLAGDLLPEPTMRSRIASGYNRLNMTTEEGGAQAKEYAAKYSADRVRNAASVWLAATLACAECHDHKYDPYSTKDFYAFAAFFADVKETVVGKQEANLLLPTPEQEQQFADYDQKLKELANQLQTLTPELAEAQAQWEVAVLEAADPWQVTTAFQITSKGKAEYQLQENGSFLATGPNPERDTLVVQYTGAAMTLRAIRMEVLPDASLPAGGPGRAHNGNFVLNDFQVQRNGKKVPIKQALASHSQGSYPIAATIDKDRNSGWAILPQTNRANQAVFILEQALELQPTDKLEFQLVQNYGSAHTIGHFRLSLTSQSASALVIDTAAFPAQLRELLHKPKTERTEAETKQLTEYFLATTPLLDPVRKEQDATRKAREQLRASLTRTMVSESMSPRTIRVLPRGNWLDDSGEVVQPQVPAVFTGLASSDRRANRLDLANWLVDRQNPVVARVFVNRLWKLLFGYGLVRTLDDFGSQGELPTHPDLLDWLAVEFIESGWDVKQLVRTLVASKTYQQSSIVTPADRQRDPFNRYFARQTRYRLEAEMVRDNALAVSGLLVRAIGGESVKPYQPAGYWQHLNFPTREWQADQGDNLYRRGLYTYWCRTFLHPSLRTFDAPTREECCAERTRSNTPLQALVLLNDPTYVEAARALAHRILTESERTAGLAPPPANAFAERLQLAFRHVLMRAPTDQEQNILRQVYEEQRAEFQQNPQAVQELLQVGKMPNLDHLDKVELASWTSVARVLLNLHETITRD